MKRFYVVTGGPGAGKSTLLAALHRRGLHVSAEVGRAVIRDAVAAGGDALPWSDREAFATRMLTAEIAAYRTAEAMPGTVFFDRGVPDVVGYRRLVGLPVPPDAAEAAERYRYNPLVFVAPPWREIYTADAERKQDVAEAEATYATMVETYRSLGYDLATLPRTDVEARAAFVLETVGRSGAERGCI